MKAKAEIEDTKNLYDYWGERLYRSVLDDSRIIINLASKEYSIIDSTVASRISSSFFLSSLQKKIRDKISVPH